MVLDLGSLEVIPICLMSMKGRQLEFMLRSFAEAHSKAVMLMIFDLSALTRKIAATVTFGHYRLDAIIYRHGNFTFSVPFHADGFRVVGDGSVGDRFLLFHACSV